MVAFQILLSVGRFEGKRLIDVWDRIPLRAPIEGTSSKLNWVVVAPAHNFDERQLLPSGQFRSWRLLASPRRSRISLGTVREKAAGSANVAKRRTRHRSKSGECIAEI
jgi:hypothetical protein